MGLILDTCILVRSEKQSKPIDFNQWKSYEEVYISAPYTYDGRPYHREQSTTYETGPITADKSVAESCFTGKFWTQYMAAKYALPYLQKNGSIVMMSGAASQRLPKGFHVSAYVACNSAIEGLVRGLAIELAPNIRVNGVSPGTSATPLWETREQKLRETAYSVYRENCLLEKVGDAVDTAQAVIYLMTNKNTTGSVLFPDGGFTLR